MQKLGSLVDRRRKGSDPRVSSTGIFSVSKVTRLPLDPGSLLVIKEHVEGLLHTRQTLGRHRQWTR